MISSDEEPDYMSESIIASCMKNDVRPGLVFSHTMQRMLDVQAKKLTTDAVNKRRNPKSAVQEAVNREEGLKKSIGSDNKGFALLQKMGYQPGTAIGKTGVGRTEPVPVTIKSNRQGLGLDAALKDVQRHRIEIRVRRLKMLEENASTYRQRLSNKASERQALSDLRRSQRVCEQLDHAEKVSKPAHAWFWPEKQKDEELVDNSQPNSDDESDDEFDVSEQLEIITVYLRKMYNYCVWCGTRYDDEGDLKNECPGSTRDDH